MGKYTLLEDIFGIYICKEKDIDKMLLKYKKYGVKILVKNKTRQYILEEYMLDILKLEQRG